MKKDVLSAIAEYKELMRVLIGSGKIPFVSPIAQDGFVTSYKKPNGGDRGDMNQILAAVSASGLINLAGFENVSEYWLSYSQAKDLGGTLMDSSGKEYIPAKKDGTNQFLPKIVKKEEWELTPKQLLAAKDPQDKSINYNKENDNYEIFTGWGIYKVFNAVEFKGLPNKFYSMAKAFDFTDDEKVARIRKAADDNGIKVQIGKLKPGSDGTYNRRTDTITLKVLHEYKNAENLASIFAHEVGHGLHSFYRANLGKDMETPEERDKAYAIEEVVVEMSSGMLLSAMGVHSTINNNASYIQHYLDSAGDDFPKIFMKACGVAGRLVRTLNNNDPMLAKFMDRDMPIAVRSATYLARESTKDPYDAKNHLLKSLGVGSSLFECFSFKKKVIAKLASGGDLTPVVHIEQMGGKAGDSILGLAVIKLKEGSLEVKSNGMLKELEMDFNKVPEVDVLAAEPTSSLGM